jgi:hypothetical protein
MSNTTGSWPLSHESKPFPNSARTLIAEITRLVIFGAMATALHAATRGRVELGPGHQGLTWIALLMIGRMTSNLRWAGTTAALGAAGATLLPFWRLGDPFLALTSMTAGAAIDLVYGLRPVLFAEMWAAAIVGGLAHATKPLLRFLITGFTGFRYESLLAGLPYPTASHFMFGAIGALLGCGIVRMAWPNRNSS